MDIATVVGLLFSISLILWSMDNAAGINAFIDTTSIAIVFGGSILVLLMRSRLGDLLPCGQSHHEDHFCWRR